MSKKISNLALCIATLCAYTSFNGLALANATPGFNNKIPEKIMTPDVVNTRIGQLKFSDGMPDKKTAEKLYNNLDFMRGIEVFLNGIPAASLEAMRQGFADMGVKHSNQVMLFDHLMNSNSLFLTGNTDTVYAVAFFDLKKNGPTVVEMPKGSGPGTIDDAWFRFVVDMGPPGLDKGQGGKYLILPPGYKGDIPKGYFVVHSKTYINLLLTRGFLVDGKPDAAANMYKEGLKIYPLKDAKNQPKMEFISGSNKAFNTVHANNFEFYNELNNVIQYEPVSMIGPQLRGLISSIGIQKGKNFDPNARMKKILTEAVAVGNATARALSFQPRDKRNYLYPTGQWKTALITKNYQWLKDNGKGGYDIDARAYFFYVATLNSNAMFLKIPGKGSKYALTNKDAAGNYLNGSKYYQLNIPANVPAKNFWSIVLYDPQTRSELQTSQPFPSKNNRRDKLVENENGSVTFYFGPKPLKDKKQNWIQTVPGKNWFAMFRVYGPLKPWFNKTWKPGEIQLMKNIDSES